jgi:hypothetical protein
MVKKSLSSPYLPGILCLLMIGTSATFPQSSGAGQDSGSGPINPAPPKGLTPEQVIQKFAVKEREFKTARDQYIYRQSVKLQTLDGNTVDGEFQQVSDILFDNKGKRIERVLFAPQPTLARISMSKEDFDDIQNLLPFVLTSDEIPEYQILYVGQQHVDELDTYVFDIAPKQIEKGKRYFQGRIWVDSQDLQVVKSYGKPVPETRITNPKKQKNVQENLFPRFTTYRELIDGKYWFPTYCRADEVLRFATGDDVHIRITVKYTDYHRFGSDVKITYDGQDITHGGQPANDGNKPSQPK